MNRRGSVRSGAVAAIADHDDGQVFLPTGYVVLSAAEQALAQAEAGQYCTPP